MTMGLFKHFVLNVCTNPWSLYTKSEIYFLYLHCFMCWDCVLLITVYKIGVFIVKIQRCAKLMEDSRIVLCDNNLVIVI